MTSPGHATFHFRASTPEGDVLGGELAASSELDAMRQLRAAGYVPLRLQPNPIRESLLDREIGIGSRRRLTVGECESFSRELAILLAAGLELTVALGALLESMPRRSRVRAFVLKVRQWLRMGSSLADSIRRSRYELPPDFLPAVEAGERAGRLESCLMMVADRLRDAGVLSRTISGALAYPLFLLVTAAAVVLVLAFFVAPNLAGLFISMERPVPAVIAMLDGAQRFVLTNPVAIALSLCIATLVVVLLSRQRGVRLAVRRLAFRIPILGTALAWGAAGRFAATLRLLIANGLPLSAALPQAFATAGFPARPGAETDLAQEMRRGGRLSVVLGRSGQLPLKVIHLLGVGEANARLPEVLGAIVDEARIRFEQRLNMLSALLAPTLILAVGVIVGWIIFTVFSALMSINDIAFR